MSEHSAENGRPLGAASGGEPGFWDRLGIAEDGMPRHLPMGVLNAGQGPVGDDIAHHYVCWCGDVECPLTLALGHAWKAGRRVLPPGGRTLAEITADSERMADEAEARHRDLPPDGTDEDNPIIHRPGCSWETTPYCDCGADSERVLPPADGGKS